MDRRRFIGGLAAFAASTRTAAQPEQTLRFGITAVFLYDRLRMLARWRSYLETALGVRVTFIQRGIYSPIIDGLRAGQIDFAWVCGYPYVLHQREFRLIAVPIWRGAPVYQSYLIAGADSRTNALGDLAGRTFAFSDPLSNSGYLYIRYVLARQGRRVEEYFSRTFFAHSHPNVVEAVAEGLSAGGAVDGYVWEVLAEVNPKLTQRTRVLQRSPDFGFPPLVAAGHVAAPLRARVEHALHAMHEAPDGRAVLDELRLDRLAPGTPQLFDSIRHMAEAVG
jgi:phosphonate transport system substrate-binding protein